MQGGAAAVSKQRRQLEKAKERRRAELRKKRAERAKRAEDAFNKLSEDGKVLPESLVPDFLARAVQLPRDMLEPNAVELVVTTARGNTEGESLAKDALLGAVRKYAEYVRKSKNIDEMFDKFDTNKDGVLSRSELKKALQAHEKKTGRSGKAFGVELTVDDKDVDFILEQTDADHDGTISRSELLPAIAAWEELAAIKLENLEKKTCTIS